MARALDAKLIPSQLRPSSPLHGRVTRELAFYALVCVEIFAKKLRAPEEQGDLRTGILNFARALILAFGLMRLDAQLAVKEGLPASIEELEAGFGARENGLRWNVDHHESLRWDRLTQGNMTKLIQGLLQASEYDHDAQAIGPLIDGMIFKRVEAT